MAKLFGGYKSIFSCHVNHIHINFPSALGWVRYELWWYFSFHYLSSKFSCTHRRRAHSAAVNKRCFLAYGPRKKKKSKKSKSLVAFIHDSVFSALLICYNISTLCYAFTAMANIQNSYECPCHYTPMYTFLSWRIAEAF